MFLKSKGFDFTQTTSMIDLFMAVADRLYPNDHRKTQLTDFCKHLNTYLENQSRTINFSFHADAADGRSDDIGKDIIDK